MKALANNINTAEVEKVLKVRSCPKPHAHINLIYSKNDKRYIMFDHVPEQRQRWITVSGPLKFGGCLLMSADIFIPAEGSGTVCARSEVNVVSTSSPQVVVLVSYVERLNVAVLY
jgi:hypothetical protein